MIIKNWMQKDPVKISSNMTAGEAMKIFDEHDKLFIPVVDKGKLRGILAKNDLREAASWVTATENIHELNFFNSRLKVKDLMVRKPVTLSADDPVEVALSTGAKLGVRFFPVKDGEEVVGTVSDSDIFKSLYQILGVGEGMCGITLENDEIATEDIADLVKEIAAVGGSIHSLFMLKDSKSNKGKLLLRFKSNNLEEIVSRINSKGYRIIEAIKHEITS
jgi:acetoin utilization protein AcuB